MERVEPAEGQREPRQVMPPQKEHPPELVVCAYCGCLIEDGYYPYHPCEEREQAMRRRDRGEVWWT